VVLATPPLKLITAVTNVIFLFVCAYNGVKLVVPTLYFYCAYNGVKIVVPTMCFYCAYI
jgi:hypothetical protein